ncbi:selenide, water dikinase SelD [Sulfitobacter sp. EhC04]|uniref:selenide, water dikinase SelD n=1 Tax=Sulfitobacter sp. EhC04 TaxID=1849168 RepID=UPI0007F3549E|nr:selenide, water dikinase SelD [Sulfitobacter sp. EhC04]OAN78510.1 selenide, water dikinase SelD [Sulfitobacter sp. EhC04]
MLNAVPLTRDLVLVGGGHAHALVLRAWGMDPLPGVRVTVINPGPTAPYTGMLPGHVAGHYGRDELEIDLGRLCRHAGARLILGRVDAIDRTARQVRVAGRGPVGYDVASIDVGITAQMDVPGFADHAVGAKPLDAYAARWRAFLERVAAGAVAPEVVVIGGGVAGCELSMAMAHALREAGARPQVTVIEAGTEVSRVGDRARRQLLSAMRGLGVVLRTGVQVARIEAERVVLEDGSSVPARFCVGAAGAFAQEWIAGTDLPQRDGFIKVGPDLGVLGDSRLFAVGDCAEMVHAPRPKAGVFAVRAAPVLHDNLRSALGAGRRRAFRPQKHYLKLISLGGRSALAEKFGLAVSAPWMWRWKDRIDKAFMDRLSTLPLMPQPRVSGPVAQGVAEALAAKPLCGGCGAKVDGGVLGGVLAQIGQGGNEVVTGPGDDAAILRQPNGGFQVISADHLRAFIEDPHLMARIAAVHALGDVWAMGATPQAVLSSIILPQMSAQMQARTLAEITQATQEVLAEVGAQLVGGHTTMGAELTLGFTVTGLRDDMPLTQGGAQSGDLLILTRPVGSGVLLAADMAGLADGRDLAAALAVMARPQHREATVLARVAHAMTDVTGFGLAGHLAAMGAASGLDVEIWGDRVPYYAGAQALSGAGVASSLMAANRANAPVSGRADPLLFDPQTAGGLLAAVPEAAAEATLIALAAQGCDGHLIGRMSPGGGALRVT